MNLINPYLVMSTRETHTKERGSIKHIINLSIGIGINSDVLTYIIQVRYYE